MTVMTNRGLKSVLKERVKFRKLSVDAVVVSNKLALLRKHHRALLIYVVLDNAGLFMEVDGILSPTRMIYLNFI